MEAEEGLQVEAGFASLFFSRHVKLNGLRAESNSGLTTGQAFVCDETHDEDTLSVRRFAKLRGRRDSDGMPDTSGYAEKLLPQPQLLTAFGLSNVKPRLSRPV